MTAFLLKGSHSTPQYHSIYISTLKPPSKKKGTATEAAIPNRGKFLI